MENVLGGGLLACMAFGFFLAGAGLIKSALDQLQLVRQRKAHMIEVMGVVTGIHSDFERRGSSSRTSGPDFIHYPIVEYTMPSGEKVTFQSETGNIGDLPEYEEGQSVPVLYDPTGQLKPVINRKGALTEVPMMIGAGGAVLVLGSFLVAFIFVQNFVL
jgi:hypothetical protein